jgi:hypothetical protein
MNQVYMGLGLELLVENSPFDIVAVKASHPALTANNDTLPPGRMVGQA